MCQSDALLDSGIGPAYVKGGALEGYSNKQKCAGSVVTTKRETHGPSGSSNQKAAVGRGRMANGLQF